MSTAEIWMVVFNGIGLLVTGGSVAVAIWIGKKVTDVKLTGQPVSVQVMEHLHDRFASKAAFEAHVEKCEGEQAAIREMFRTEIPEMERRLNEGGESRIRRVHQRIDPLSQGIAALCARQGLPAPKQNFSE